MNHGVAAYNRGCRCPECREASRIRVADYAKRVYLNRGPLRVDATGTRRRIQALAAIGWTFSEQARRAGVSVQALHRYTRTETTTPVVRDRVHRLYDELSGTPGPSKYARTTAARHGWARPIDWDDDALDDPGSAPWTTTFDTEVDLDPVVVDRLLAGTDWRAIGATRAERIAAAERTPVVAEAERRYGLRAGRDFRRRAVAS